MKQLILTAIVFTGLNTSLLKAQEKSTFSFCNGTKDKDVISIANFDNCLDLLSIEKNLVVQSYSIVFLMPNQKDSIYADFPVYGSKAGNDAVEALKKHKPEKILIEQIKALDATGTIKKYPGMVLYSK